MGSALHYNFSAEELRRGIYLPIGHVEREESFNSILRGLSRILRGEGSFAIRITDAPASPELVALQKQLTDKMITAYAEDGALKVRILNDQK
jgi:hypothetical protein